MRLKAAQTAAIWPIEQNSKKVNHSAPYLPFNLLLRFFGLSEAAQASGSGFWNYRLTFGGSEGFSSGLVVQDDCWRLYLSLPVGPTKTHHSMAVGFD